MLTTTTTTRTLRLVDLKQRMPIPTMRNHCHHLATMRAEHVSCLQRQVSVGLVLLNVSSCRQNE
jgi:hypothetical protein